VGNVHAYDVGGLDADVLHVLSRGSYVLGGYVATTQRFEVAAEGAEEFFGFVAVRVADDDGLSAPKIKAARGGLVGHPSCQA
jgi:hypothetical protein